MERFQRYAGRDKKEQKQPEKGLWKKFFFSGQQNAIEIDKDRALKNEENQNFFEFVKDEKEDFNDIQLMRAIATTYRQMTRDSRRELVYM